MLEPNQILVQPSSASDMESGGSAEGAEGGTEVSSKSENFERVGVKYPKVGDTPLTGMDTLQALWKQDRGPRFFVSFGTGGRVVRQVRHVSTQTE